MPILDVTVWPHLLRVNADEEEDIGVVQELILTLRERETEGERE